VRCRAQLMVARRDIEPPGLTHSYVRTYVRTYDRMFRQAVQRTLFGSSSLVWNESDTGVRCGWGGMFVVRIIKNIYSVDNSIGLDDDDLFLCSTVTIDLTTKSIYYMTPLVP
jgi:hypothetical protein